MFNRFLLPASMFLGLLGMTATATGSDGLVVRDLVTGTGPKAELHATVQVHYTGWLEDGQRFDSSHDRGQPLGLTLGQGQVIPGWEQGLLGMQVGGKRELIIPPELAYGARGAGNVIPPNARLRFEVEMVSIQAPPFGNLDNDEMQAKLASGVKLIDIRTPEEWAETGVVPGSHLLMAFDAQGRLNPEFLDQLGRIVSPQDEFMIICRTGNRTGALARALVEQTDYVKVQNVTDGIVSWIADQRIVKRDCPSLDAGSSC